jgi:alkaline phosphatase
MFVAGPGAEAFAGFRENTEIGQALLSLVRAMGN